jgi:hypothetical protein
MFRVDGRSTAGRFLARVMAELRAGLGREPDEIDRHLIEHIAELKLRCRLIESQSRKNGSVALPSEKMSEYYLTWSNALQRALYKLAERKVQAAPSAPASKGELHVSDRATQLARALLGHRAVFFRDEAAYEAFENRHCITNRAN